MKEKIIQNIKIIKIMKASGYKDSDIAKYLDMKTYEFLKIIGEDDYLTEVYGRASELLGAEIESKFLDNVVEKLDKGDTTDAKWTLERTNPKYTKKEQVDVNMRSIDDIIRDGGK